MVNLTIGEPGAIWQQLANAFFLSAGLFNDLLCVRTSLTMSYVFLFITGWMGAPRWSDSFNPTGFVSVDTIVWAVLNLFVHFNSVMRMFYDERNIKLSDDEYTLWLMFFRHSGISKLQFKARLCPNLQVIELPAGTTCCSLSDSPCSFHMEYFYIVLDGVVSAEAFNGNTGKKHTFPMISGQMFPLQHIYSCTQNRSVEAMSTEHTFANTWVSPTAVTNVKMYRFSATFLRDLSMNKRSSDIWLAFLSTVMAVVATTPYYDDTDVTEFVKNERNAHIVYERSPFFSDLSPSEEPNPLSAGSTKALRRPFIHLLHSYRSSFTMPWPIGVWPQGLRHRLPTPMDPRVRKTIKYKTQQLRDSILSFQKEDIFRSANLAVTQFLLIHVDDDDEDDVANDKEVPYGTFGIPDKPLFESHRSTVTEISKESSFGVGPKEVALSKVLGLSGPEGQETGRGGSPPPARPTTGSPLEVPSGNTPPDND